MIEFSCNTGSRVVPGLVWWHPNSVWYVKSCRYAWPAWLLKSATVVYTAKSWWKNLFASQNDGRIIVHGCWLVYLWLSWVWLTLISWLHLKKLNAQDFHRLTMQSHLIRRQSALNYIKLWSPRGVSRLHQLQGESPRVRCWIEEPGSEVLATQPGSRENDPHLCKGFEGCCRTSLDSMGSSTHTAHTGPILDNTCLLLKLVHHVHRQVGFWPFLWGLATSQYLEDL